MGEYRQIDHTADLAVRVSGNSLEDLFNTAANAMVDLAINDVKIKPVSRKDFEFSAHTSEELLVNFLSELNFLLQAKKWIFRSIRTFQMKPQTNNLFLELVVEGGSPKAGNFQIQTEIKAITFHGLEIKESGGKFETIIVFDI